MATVDNFLMNGCGRCKLANTPDCKVHRWQSELNLLREIALASGLTETIKWGFPTYTLNGKNIFIIHAFKDYCGLSFFKGSLLTDSKNLLQQATENMHVSRQLKFTSVDQIELIIKDIDELIHNAITVEKQGQKVAKRTPESLNLPEELIQLFQEDERLKSAFHALTPGRQRGYALYFSGAKQAATRLNRIEKYIPKILKGKGFHDED
jgi:uncharacterized protein YdeI (YjbR/CyaY-like superfamily)